MALKIQPLADDLSFGARVGGVTASLLKDADVRAQLNQLFEDHQNLWKGTGKTLMIRAQLGRPLAVYAGDEVEVCPTDVPKSTAFRVDGKYLFVYRAEYTVYENSLLK